MKERIGFVSNSSSSSFLIYGICMSKSTAIEKYRAYKGVSPKTSEDDEDEDDDFDYYEISEIGEGISVDCPYGDSELFIGTSWSDVKDDETGKQFKERVGSKLKEVFGSNIALGTLSEAWRDG